ncbi:twin arginine-targeting protein translocase TatC [Anoxybacter fermentans]|uniref:Sec-independent protein translocase protein TatC n=1 Tax=Anoxybacter fermentans TaxID=1323375 RepID=A0A3S9SXH0_9FIRM|nr:twin-arginine translocase subunit TatC [Anoxybacter fermentans]AZR72942.1 twin arginine-targeting protein translocase TatC [Anoxybacter fermentans]
MTKSRYDQKMTLVEHLTDLRKCIIKAILGWLVGIVLIFLYADRVYYYMTEPLGVTNLVYISPIEGFLTYLKIAIYGGLMLASPVIIYQLFRFVLPGLYQHERVILFTLIPTAFLLMVVGISFGYFVVLPFALKYLLNFSSLNVQPMLSMQKYIGFVTTSLMILGIVFEMPLVVIGLTKLGVVTPKFLRKHRKYAIVLSVAVGAILTPPDVITQVMMAGPLLFLYEISIWLSYLFWSKKQRKKEKTVSN